jgi:hypothetical protein
VANELNWLPNLVSGVSLWRLVGDLNDPRFMDGRLLAPETEGPDTLPTDVRWNTGDAIPLPTARTSHPEAVETAIAEFRACLARVEKELANKESPFHKFKDAFVVPSAETGESYYFDPTDKKLRVANWGASPRAIGGSGSFLGMGSLAQLFAPAAAAAILAAPVAAAAAEPPKEATKPPEEEEKKPKEEAKKGERSLLAAIVIAALLALLVALFLWKFRDCNDRGAAIDAGGDALADSALSDGSADSGPDGGTDSGLDGGSDASDGGDAGDSGADASDGGDAGTLAEDDDVLIDETDVQSEVSVDSDTSLSGASKTYSTSKGKLTVAGGGKGKLGKTPGRHRVYVAKDAVAWRVASGKEKVVRTLDEGHRFDAWVGEGASFEGVRVEYKDAAGKWHVH